MADGDIDFRSFFTLSYGIYILGSHREGRLNGQISNSVMQVSDDPPRICAAVNKKSLTHEFIAHSGSFSVTVLAESAPMEFIGIFGFRSGRDVDKLAGRGATIGTTGCPVFSKHGLACIEVRVNAALDAGSHTVFIGDVVAARITGEGRPMTYAYYRKVLRGKTPPTAPTYRASAAQASTPKNEKEVDSRMKRYECTVCGYVYDPEKGDPDNGVEPGTAFEDIPDDWVCPVCGASKDQFEPTE